MRSLRLFTAGLVLVLFQAACQRKAPVPDAAKPEAVASPPEGYAGVANPATPSPTASVMPAEPAEDVKAAATVNMDATNAENQLVKNEVLARVDAMPSLSPEEKDKLYVQVDRARGMGKLVTIPFSSGKASAGPKEVAALRGTFQLPQIQKYAEDPTVVFVVLGFADKKGDPKTNQEISLRRAQSIVDALKAQAGIMNVMHAVGMGSSEMFDAQNLEKNRVVEVWAVLP